MAYGPAAAEDVTGEVRSALAPSKPQRTASMRDQTVLQPPLKKRNVPCDIGIRDYEKPDSVRTPTSDSPVNKKAYHTYINSIAPMVRKFSPQSGTNSFRAPKVNDQKINL